MNQANPYVEDKERQHSDSLLDSFQSSIHKRTDRLFVYLMSIQWLGGIIAALIISPKTWQGTFSQTHVHVWAAILIGGILTSFPVYLCLRRPGRVLNRHVVAVAQMLTSALLIHLTGGRIETHFHVFGSLAFLAFYRDRKVLVTATLIVTIDHLVRGIWWPQSVFGVLTSSHWRWIEHAAWVIFEDIFLFISINQALKDMRNVSERQAKVEYVNQAIEKRVVERTRELHQEINEKKRIEEELRNREILLRSTLESTADGILVVNSEKRATQANKKFREIWKIPENIVSQGDALVIRKYALEQLKYPQEFLIKLEEVYQSHEEVYDELEFKDGRIIERFSAPLSKNNVEAGRVWSFRDVTAQRKSEEAQKELQEQLDKAERMEALGQLAGGVAHDLNNMLGPVVGYSELLINELPADSKLAKRAAKIKKSAEQAAVVIQDLLTMARRGKYEMKPVDLNEVVKGYMQSPSFENLTSRFPKIKSKTKLSKEPGVILGSPAHLEKVLMNVVTNAFEAMSPGGQLVITTEKLKVANGQYLVLRVTDTGHGIEDDDMNKIFEPFFSKKQMGTSGTGLGLSVVYGIVKDHRGLVDVQSQVGKGTEFALYFPVAQGINAPKEGVQFSVVGGSETILVVDDSLEQRELIREVIDNLGYFVVTAPDGQFAIDFIKAHPVDLVILDMMMEPDFDGLDTYREMLKINPQQKAIVVSGFSEGERVQEIMNLGGAAFVKKPYNIDTLAAAIRKALDNPSTILDESKVVLTGPSNQKQKDED